MKPARGPQMRPFVTVLLGLGLLLLFPGLSWGHASLVEAEPTRGAALDSVPSQVVLAFSEPVEASFGAVRVFDSRGREVQSGEPTVSSNGSQLSVGLEEGLGDDFYTTTYRVVSEDAHPVSGGFVFTVGSPGSAPSSTVSELLADTETGRITEAVFWLDRWAGYLAIAVAVGLLGFLLMVWAPILRGREATASAGAAAASARFALVLAVAIAVGLVASLMALVLQGATAAGTTFWAALDPQVIERVLETRFGEVMALRSVAWLGLLPLAVAATGTFGRRHPLAMPQVALAVVASLFLIASPALAGHASTQEPGWLLMPATVVHVAAMAVWSGGLVALLLVLPDATRELDRGPTRTGLLCDSLLRFSTVALAAVVLIALTGTVQTVIEVGSFSDMVETAFGRAVLAKIAAFILLVAVAASMRRRVIPALVGRAEARESPGGPGLTVRRNLRIETGLAVLVLAVTAALVSYPPPTAAQGEPVSGTVLAGSDQLDYTVDPALPGGNEVHIYLFDGVTGAPVDVEDLELSFSLPSKDIPPIDEEVRRVGPGHFFARSAMLSVEGEWRARAVVRLSEFEETVADFDVEIG